MVKSNFNQPGDHPAGTNGPWAVTPSIRSSSGTERKKMMLIHANLSNILKQKLRLPPSTVRAPVAGPETIIEGGKTRKGTSEVKAGQEEKSSSGHQLQSISSTGFSSSSSSSPSPEGSSSGRKKMMMIHATLSKILKHKLRLPHRWPGPLVAGPDTIIKGGKTPKGSSGVKAGQEEKRPSGQILPSKISCHCRPRGK